MTRALSKCSRIAAAGLLVVASCASPDAKERSVASSGSSIIAGTLDTTHTAVVAVASNTTVCSGTIVQVVGSTGYVLTAAHCCATDTPTEIIVGNDYNLGQVETVVPGSVFYDASFDPNASTGIGDFCMVKFSGASAGTPVLAVTTSPDGAAAGDTTTVVGYGTTAPPPGGANTKRRQATSNVETVAASTLQMSRSPNDGGPCAGDSGGPVLFNSGGTESVWGVVSQFGETCESTFLASRVTSELGAGKFITAYLSDSPIGKHVLDDGGTEEIDSDAGTDVDGGGTKDGGSSSTNDGGSSSGSDAGGSGGNGDGGSSNGGSAASSDDGGGCSTSGGSSNGALAVIAFGILAITRRKRRR